MRESLILNETSCNDSLDQAPEYRPLTMMLYGGFHGIHLSKMTGIVIWILDFERIYGIDFTYSTEVDGEKVHTLGRRRPFSESEPRHCEPFNSSTDQSIIFPIDGAGGEIIDGIDVQ